MLGLKRAEHAFICFCCGPKAAVKKGGKHQELHFPVVSDRKEPVIK